MANIKVGISSIGLHIPSLAMSLEELAKLRNVDPNKFLVGLGCKQMALCPPGYTVADLAVEAAKRALSRWNGDKSQIGLVAVGTESADDMSRPLSASVAEQLGLTGAIRSYEVKHACYGGTLAVRQATEWKLANITPGKAALVIAADIATYKQNEPGEPTQGAGAVALIIDDPKIAEVEAHSYPWSIPVYDFWHPLHEPYPLVDGQFSLECYLKTVKECFKAFVNGREPNELIEKYVAHCFHTPFPKMVKKAFYEACRLFGWNDEKIEKLFMEKVYPTLEWNQLTGNAYTASLWISVSNTLRKMKQGEKITAFSYGSGCGAELLVLKAGPIAHEGAWANDIEKDVKERKLITAEEYMELRNGKKAA